MPLVETSWLGLIELFVVLLFAMGWGVLELVALRFDKRRKQQNDRAKDLDEPPG
jgi:hypothetical protein